MTLEVVIRPETAKHITAQQEHDLLSSAFASNPSSRLLRSRLAVAQSANDAFDATVALLDGADDLDFRDTLMLGRALLAKETTAATIRARETAQRALLAAEDDLQRAAALADKGKAEVRLGDDAAFVSLTSALTLDPYNKDACKRLAALHLGGDDPHAVLAFTAALQQRGVGHSRLFAARALAFARLGDTAAAREVVGLGRFLSRRQLPPPPGWESIRAFNEALAAELSAHPGLRRERYGSASQLSWRIESPASHVAPLTVALAHLLAAEAERLIAEHADESHAWLAARPEAGILHSWCAITEDVGYEDWHVHQFGWLSGVYYVSVPDSVARGQDAGGCIAFGLPEDLAGREAAEAFGVELVRPSEGLALFFPSHAYHRTFAHGAGERRICIAFDVWPRSGGLDRAIAG
jgi:hypothetical protein